ncbi:YbaK/EbsC family protein [Inhella gelatinilytica]|uniref:YbaK/EbsC family protein n=1 Tax=Inhella gelatinilytica TaxID=2795030 RepID=A0A931IVT4_9BURK|nr:YbaK/EbsC family protein [Inhella gelatinilytica]MBH9552852.1 YbaK/EbsC family protein [Inhella gelatinilytica]
MTDEIETHPSVERVRAALQHAGVDYEIRWLADGAHTAADAAAQLGVPLGAIAKSVVLRLGDQPVLCITAGDRRVNAERLVPQFGPVARADAAFVRRHTGFPIGGVAPLGFAPQDEAAPPAVLMDPSLERFERVWAAAGHPRTVLGLRFDALQQAAAARLEAFTDAV